MDGVVKLFSNENDSHAREKMMNDKMWAKDLAYDESHLILFFHERS